LLATAVFAMSERRRLTLDEVTRRWPWRLAVAFVLLTLLTLAIVPWLVQTRVDELRADIVASEPARTVVMRWQFELVTRLAALDNALITGDTSGLSHEPAAVAAMHARLQPLVRQLGHDVIERYVEARTLDAEWEERMTRALRARAEGQPTSQVTRVRNDFTDVIVAVAALDSSIIVATGRARDDIVRAERTGLALTFAMGLLALLASVAVIGLERRVRRLAAEAEARRAEATAALAESVRAGDARTRLLRGVTHDVKNPLGAAKGYAELLTMGVKGPLTPEQVRLVQGVERSVDSALGIIADLLDLARADSGAITVRRVEADLNRLVREAAEDHRALARSAGHQLETVTPAATLPIHTDPVRVRQILDNLLSNAIKYTPAPGHIALRACADSAETPPRPGLWGRIEVHDDGPGIPPDQREAVFDEFSRLDDRAGAAGHGLGLAIARSLARQLGGDLTIADRSPGATFVLWLPRRSEGADAAGRAERPSSAAPPSEA
jgi:signal transduction histidine kinase